MLARRPKSVRLLAGAHSIMQLDTYWRMPRKEDCKLCGKPMDGEAAVQGTDGQSDKKMCILCAYTEFESLCKDCYVPWLPEWTQTMMNLPPYLLRDSQLHSRGQFVCLQCVSEEEYGLSARQQLSEEQAEQLDAIEFRAEQQGGFPRVEIVSATTLYLRPT